MKRLLSLLGVVSLTASGAATVVACGASPDGTNTTDNDSLKQEIILSEVNASVLRTSTKNISVSNYADLGTISVSSNNQETVSAVYANGIIALTGLKIGSAIITVNATQAISAKTLTISVLNNELTIEDIESSERQDTISKLMSQYAKTLYLNQNTLSDGTTHFSSQYLMSSFVKGSYLSDLGINNLNAIENVTSKTKFSAVADQYFSTDNILASDVTLSSNLYQDLVTDPSVAESGAVDIVKNTLPLILGFVSNPSTLKSLLPVLAADPSMISSFLTPELLGTLSTVLSQENLESIQSALSNDIYAGFNFQQTLDSSVIGLSNAIDKMLNPETYTKLSYSTLADVQANIATANSTLAVNAYALTNGDVTLQVDLLSNIDSIVEVVRFVRTLMVYLDQFSYGDMTSGVLTRAQVEAKRSAIIDTNTVDVKSAIEKISFMASSDDSGIVFKNYIAALLQTNTPGSSFAKPVSILEWWKPANKDFTANVNDGLMGLVSKIAIQAMGEYTDTSIAYGKIYTNVLIRSFINGGLHSGDGGGFFSTVMPLLTSEIIIAFIPSPVKEILQAISRSGDSKAFQSDWMGYLWNNTNAELGFNVQNLFTTPVDQISFSGLLGSSTTEDGTATEEETTTPTEEEPTSNFNQGKEKTIDFFEGKTIKDIAAELSTAYSKSSNVTIDFNQYEELFARLAKDEALQKGLQNPDNLLTSLGLSSSGTLVSGSAFEQIFTILESSTELTKQLNTLLSGWISESNKKADTIEREAKNIFRNATVETTINGVNDFTYVVTYGEVTSTFNIKLKYEGNKLVISEITLVEEEVIEDDTNSDGATEEVTPEVSSLRALLH